MKRVVILLLVLGAIGAGIGFYMYNKPVASLANKKPDVEVSASQIVTDYEADEKAADAKYLGKIVLVNGTIAEIATEEGSKKIHLATDNPISMVICELEDDKKAEEWKAGDEIKIKGLCSGYLSDVHIEQSCVVKK